MTKDEILDWLAAKKIDVATASQLLAQLEKSAETGGAKGNTQAPRAEVDGTSRRDISVSSSNNSGCFVIALVTGGLLWLIYAAATSDPAKHDPYADNPLSDPDLYRDNPWHR